MRIVNHHHTQYIVRRIANSDKNDPGAGYLAVQTSDWLDSQQLQVEASALLCRILTAQNRSAVSTAHS